MTQLRQGDVLFVPASAIPADAKPTRRDHKRRLVVAEGEVTGHAHAILDRNAELLATKDGEQWLVILPASVPQLRTIRAKADYAPPCEVIDGPVRIPGHLGLVEITVRTDGAVIEHEEHGAVVLPPGTYHRQPQREYSPEAIRRVDD